MHALWPKIPYRQIGSSYSTPIIAIIAWEQYLQKFRQIKEFMTSRQLLMIWKVTNYVKSMIFFISYLFIKFLCFLKPCFVVSRNIFRYVLDLVEWKTLLIPNRNISWKWFPPSGRRFHVISFTDRDWFSRYSFTSLDETFAFLEVQLFYAMFLRFVFVYLCGSNVITPHKRPQKWCFLAKLSNLKCFNLFITQDYSGKQRRIELTLQKDIFEVCLTTQIDLDCEI